MTARFARHSALPAWLFALALATLALMPDAAKAADPALVPGVDYAEIPGGTRLGPDDGKVEVVEVFGYWCHHCADFAPMLENWKHERRNDVRVTYLPLPRGQDDALAAAFFASRKLDSLSRTHDATFRAIHGERLLPRNPTVDEIATFYASLGVDAARLKAAMASSEVQERLPEAREFAIGSGVEGTPTLIVNGRYRVIGRSLEDVLRIADALVARERAAAR
ncbi:thiol:disulfide interchange protein DsbA/DsbL [Marilutibacter chinensis]|uniref:Thiol:disulfide interchange protein DsbA/DsbL n=1 Tax=Marilutibacter chinensis TaxID=2912247 RepID=A0ABS9HTC7_9GAMM|nr:thiol:disulfide interchange protein DsbA/DsbL [Lysobacter chinensis]MCF7222156.1 thiol:disulfide interchange protein DsbA/DsbL [Lysobacter chinensis]